MYNFRPVTDRIASLRTRIRNRVVPVDSVRAMAITASYKENENAIPMIRRARAVEAVLRAMPPVVDSEELIVGSLGSAFCGSSIYPEWTGESWIPGYVDAGIYTKGEDGLYHTPAEDVGPLTFTEETYQDLSSIREFWQTRTGTAPLKGWQPAGFEQFQKLRMSSYVAEKDFMSSPVGHLTPGHSKIINRGYASIRNEAQRWLDEHEGCLMGDDIDKSVFYSSVVIVCNAAIDFIHSYADACRGEAESCADEKRREELQKMASGLDNIAEKPAASFWEACQAAVMYQLVLQLESGYPALSFGRFDQYVWPFLERDMASGVLTADEAQEIVDSVFLKLHSIYRVFPPVVTASAGVNTYYHTTIGGVEPETGEDATNLVTFMVLESISRLKLHDPTISLRINDNTPAELWQCALETTKNVGGLPLFQNDSVIIPTLMQQVGFSLEDARDYSLIGCQEIVGSGNDFPAPNGYNPPHCSIHYGTIMAMAINNGVNPVNNEAAPIKTGYLYEMESIEDVKDAVAKLCRYGLKWLVSMNNYTEYVARSTISHPLLSISMEGCMESGRDIIQGGCKYNSFGGTATGLATLADSLTAIRYLCFDEKLCTTRELYDAVMANWEGYDDLRQLASYRVPHYGNNDPYADEMMAWITGLYYDLCQECFSSRAKVYKSGLYGATDHLNQGRTTWATPDGRKFGEALADAVSPGQGRDKNGPTAIFNSALCFDHLNYADGMALNIKIHPSCLKGDDGVEKLSDMMKSYFASGGMEAQFNVVSNETLHAAQAEPEKYRDLVVRIAGFSAYFVEMSREAQDNLISRNENTL